MMTRIVVADDHPIIHQGVSRLEELDPSIEIVGNAKNGKEAIKLFRELRPDILILDDSMPVLDGATTAGRLLKNRKKTKIIFYTFSNNKTLIFERYKLGVKGYVLKSSPIEELLLAVNTVKEGNIYFNEEFPETSFNYYLKKKNQGGLKVTFRERQVLELIAKGDSNSFIAEKLLLSIRTIEEHRRRIKRKFNLNGANDLMRFAIEQTEE